MFFYIYDGTIILFKIILIREDTAQLWEHETFPKLGQETQALRKDGNKMPC